MPLDIKDGRAGGRAALESEFTREFVPLARSWRHALDLKLARLGLSGATGLALLLTDELGDDLRQTDLASGLDINSASLVRLVDALGESGYVERLFDPIDRRVRRVRLTASGRDAAREVKQAIAALRATALAGFDDEDLATALRVIRRIARSLDGERRNEL